MFFKQIKNYTLYVFYKIVKFVFNIIPSNILKHFFNGLAIVAYYLTPKYVRISKQNLKFVYDNISDIESKNIIIKSYKNLLYNLHSFFENQSLKKEDYEKRITVINEDYILNLLKDNRKIILVTAHFGNWEYGNTYIPLKYGPTTMVGRPLNNDLLNKELNDTRTKNNTKMLDKNNASKGLVKALKDNRIVGLVIDQNTSNGVKTKFLGKDVFQIDSASRLAIKFNAAIVPIFFTMKEFGKYELNVYKPLEPNDYIGENQIETLTSLQADVMSEHILKNPEQWFWQHRRFKTLNKEIYN